MNERNERGSVALVVIVLVLISGILAVSVERTLDDGRLARLAQDRAAALAVADLGVGDLTARVAVSERTTIEHSGNAGDANWEGTARLVDPGRWEVIVTGRSHGEEREVSAVLVKRSGTGWVVDEWRD